MKRWEYRTVWADTEPDQVILAQLGGQGWELVSVVAYPPSNDNLPNGEPRWRQKAWLKKKVSD